jgi:hypothetical protein
MRLKQYRTIWIAVADWEFLKGVSEACGLSASLLTAQSVEVLVAALKAAGVPDLVAKAEADPLASEAVRERVAQVLQNLVIGSKRVAHK